MTQLANGAWTLSLVLAVQVLGSRSVSTAYAQEIRNLETCEIANPCPISKPFDEGSSLNGQKVRQDGYAEYNKGIDGWWQVPSLDGRFYSFVFSNDICGLFQLQFKSTDQFRTASPGFECGVLRQFLEAMEVAESLQDRIDACLNDVFSSSCGLILDLCKEAVDGSEDSELCQSVIEVVEEVERQAESAGGGGGGGGGDAWAWSSSICDSSFSSGFCEMGAEPIVVDLGRPGLKLTGLDESVQFDLNADGEPDEVSWTARWSEDAFLVLDRNGNGLVDDGSELFGDSVTLLDGSRSAMGFEALWEMDLPEYGGDENGVIDRDDEIFGKLRLWTDWNHNGLSERWELRTLRSEGIIALSLDTRDVMSLDEHGNFLGMASDAVRRPRGRRHGGSCSGRDTVEIPMIDVFFLMKRD